MISIIIPTYNRKLYITKTLESVINQTYTNWECIVVDDGSTDETDKCVEEFVRLDNRISYYTRPAHMLKGANSCRNYGFLHSKGKYIKFLDSDDLLTIKCLEEQSAFLDADSNLQVCLSYGRFFINETEELEAYWSRNRDCEDLLLGHICNQIMWAISDPLWKKEFFDYPPFKEGLMNSQEWLMHGQALIKLERKEIYNLMETYSLIRKGNLRMSSSNSSNYYKNQRIARVLLFKSLIKNRTYSIKYFYPLFKQILVYFYWEIRKKYSN